MDDIVRLMARERPAVAARPLPSPEDVFLAWLLALPLGADIAAAARIEIERLTRAEPLPPGPARLRDLFEQAAAAAQPEGLSLSSLPSLSSVRM